MTDEIKVQDAGASDKVKLAAAVLVVLAGVVGYYLLAAQAAWLRWVPVVGGIVLAAFVIAWSRYGTEFWQFVLDARSELRKVVWPSREDTGKTTLVVFVFVLIGGVILWLLDLALAWATRALTGQGG